MKNRIRHIALVLAGATLMAAPAFAGAPRHGGFIDTARVVSVEPIYRTVRISTPRKECWTEQVPVEDYFDDDGYYSYTPMILGGIIGGVIGSEMGKGRGRDAAILAGTVLGGSIGRDIAERNRRQGGETVTRYETREHCRTVEEYREEERLEGYRVTYRYRGHEFVTRMDHDPGRRLKVRVRVAPAE